MTTERKYYAEILLVSFAALLMEISYTRLISFKLFYYYTYLIIGLALLGIGSGGVFVAISERLGRTALDRLIAACCIGGAVSVAIGYYVIAYMPIDTAAIWEHREVWTNVWRLIAICLALFSTFIWVGIVIASLFGREPERINGLYFADLLGAGLACAVVVPLLEWVGPPSAIFVAGVVLAGTGMRLAWRRMPVLFYTGAALALFMAAGAAIPRLLPDPETDYVKTIKPDTRTEFARWSPVFRIDVTEVKNNPDLKIVHHDGLWGSAVHRFDGDLKKLTRFDRDERSFPFRLLGDPPTQVLIIGAAGGNEILASLYFGAGHINAVELNPVTVSLLTSVMPDFSGHLGENPRVSLINDDGRSYLARDPDKYDLIFFVAPDSYTAMNAATSGAFVLSESYLYTKEMIIESLQHLTDGGVICMQFGEFNFQGKPNRTSRYVATARAAFHELGIEGHAGHILVATSSDFIPLSTILLKREPFTPDEIGRFLAQMPNIAGAKPRHVPGQVVDDGPVNRIIDLGDEQLARWYTNHPYDVRPITDDAPFFWHFARFDSVLSSFGDRLGVIDTEDSIGERLLLLLLAISIAFASVFLLLPFVTIRQKWSLLPRRLESAIYFSALGLGFMFFEVSLIQKLTLFLGYPTYSLTVTLMSLLIFTGVGSLFSGAYAQRRKGALLVLLGVIAALTLFYQFGLAPLTGALLSAGLPLRVFVAFCCLAPLGLCLGAFMPLGLGAVSRLTEHKDEYIAWGWAVNGFFSVIGSVLTTILSMTFGFRVVLMLGLAAYAIAVLVLRGISSEASAR